MTTETDTTIIRYRKTKGGEWVAYGPATMTEGAITVTKADGRAETREVVRLGRTFVADGREMVYGYLTPRETPAPQTRAMSRYLREFDRDPGAIAGACPID